MSRPALDSSEVAHRLAMARLLGVQQAAIQCYCAEATLRSLGSRWGFRLTTPPPDYGSSVDATMRVARQALDEMITDLENLRPLLELPAPSDWTYVRGLIDDLLTYLPTSRTIRRGSTDTAVQ